MGSAKIPELCCKPDCFRCPYPDCIYDGMEIDDYVESIDDFAVPETKDVMRIRNYQKKYRERHADEIKERRKKFYDDHSESCIKKSNDWKKNNRDRVNASIRAKYAKNPEYYRQKQRDYRARKKVEQENGRRKEAV